MQSLLLGTILLLYMALVRPYNNIAILVLQSSFLANLVFLSGWISFTYHTDVNNTSRPWIKTATIMVSTGVAFFQFCFIQYLLLGVRSYVMKRCCPKAEVELDDDNSDLIADRDTGYHDPDPVLNESQPLLPTY